VDLGNLVLATPRRSTGYRTVVHPSSSVAPLSLLPTTDIWSTHAWHAPIAETRSPWHERE
jgi:hypothetical protein